MAVASILKRHLDFVRTLGWFGVLTGTLVAIAGLSEPAAARSPLQYYSPTLRARFFIERFYFPGYGWHVAVGVVEMDDDSPLHDAGVRSGDIITRLDNCRVTSFSELERHYCWTTVRFYRDSPESSGRLVMYERKFHIPH